MFFAFFRKDDSNDVAPFILLLCDYGVNSLQSFQFFAFTTHVLAFDSRTSAVVLNFVKVLLTVIAKFYSCFSAIT